MQLIIVKLTAMPGKADAVIAALSEFMETGPATNGLLGYSMGSEDNAPENLIVCEQWQSAEANDAFVKTALFADFIGVLMRLLSSPPASGSYKAVAGVGGRAPAA